MWSSADVVAAARRRAEAAGYDADTLLFHGTTCPDAFTAFSVGKGLPGVLGRGVYLTRSPQYASTWAGGGRVDGGRIIPVVIRRGELLDLTRPPDGQALAARIRQRGAGGDGDAEPLWSRLSEDEISQCIRRDGRLGLSTWLERAGYIGAFLSKGDESHQLVVYRPSNIRSPWARFDPAKAHSADLLA